MPHRRLKVGVTRKLPQAVETRLAALFDVAFNADDAPLSREELVALAHGHLTA